MAYSNENVNELIYRTDTTAKFEEDDWYDLALAALDQAGCPALEYERVKRLIGRHDEKR